MLDHLKHSNPEQFYANFAKRIKLNSSVSLNRFYEPLKLLSSSGDKVNYLNID